MKNRNELIKEIYQDMLDMGYRGEYIRKKMARYFKLSEKTIYDILYRNK